MNKYKRIVADVPAEIHKDLLVAVALQGMTIQRFVSQAIIEKVAEFQRQTQQDQAGM